MRTTTRLKNIYNAVIQLLYPTSAEQTHETIVKEACKLVDAMYGSIILENNKELTRVYTTLPFSGQAKIRKNGYSWMAFTSKKAFVKHPDEDKSFRTTIKALGVKSNIFIPLSNRENSMGVLVVNSQKNIRFTKKELDTLKIFGSAASLAIHKAKLYDETQKTLNTRDLFLSMAAHKLRTPLTTISGYAQLLHNKFPKNDTAESRWIYELRWEVQRLSQLVNELLEVNRIKAGKFQYNFKEHSLSSIITRSLDKFQVLHPDRNITFTKSVDEGSDIIIGDFDKLIQVMTNLIENSIKYSPPTSPISLSLKIKGTDLSFEIKDRGRGIAKKDLQNIFEKFYRGENAMVEGMGLGLHLVKTIIKEHRGKIKINSKLGKGTTINVLLPRLKHD